jgi:dolichol-phosphate mannosyltransferase
VPDGAVLSLSGLLWSLVPQANPGSSNPSLAIIIPAWNERPSLETLLPALHTAVSKISIPYEIIVADKPSDDGTPEVCRLHGARVVQQIERGYGGALLAGFNATAATHIVTMDADLSHPPDFIESFWARRHAAEVIIASRYVRGGIAEMDMGRYLLSRLLNYTFRAAFLLPLKDVSSGFRMYHRRALTTLRFESRDFDVLEEIICLQHFRRLKILEVPFHYKMRVTGESHARILSFGVAYLKTIAQLWRRRLRADV